MLKFAIPFSYPLLTKKEWDGIDMYSRLNFLFCLSSFFFKRLHSFLLDSLGVPLATHKGAKAPMWRMFDTGQGNFFEC